MKLEVLGYNEEGNPFVSLTLTWRPIDAPEEPDLWQVVFKNYPNVFWTSLTGYLGDYCPAPHQVREMIKALDLPSSVKKSIDA